MKRSCVFAFACLFFGNAFGFPTAENLDTRTTQLADITEEVCSLKDIKSHVLILRENYECSNAIFMATIEEELPSKGNIFFCSFNWNGEVYVSTDIIVCPLETEETENIDDTDTEETE